MRYYYFHIGDYLSHTYHLSPMEDLAYRRIMDKYYLNERPLNGCSTSVARQIGLRSNHVEVEYVLQQFFTQDEGGNWRQKRIDEELETLKTKAENARLAGIKSAEARKNKAKSKVLNESSTTVERPLNDCSTTQDPRPKTQDPSNSKKSKPKKARAVFCPPTLADVCDYCNQRGNNVDPEKWLDYYTANGWMVGKNKMKDWKASVRTWERGSKSRMSTLQQQNELAAQEFLSDSKQGNLIDNVKFHTIDEGKHIDRE